MKKGLAAGMRKEKKACDVESYIRGLTELESRWFWSIPTVF